MKRLLIVDSREKQKAIKKILEQFDKANVRHVSSKLLFGDYMDYNIPSIVIDRKQTIAELAKNVTVEKDRFRREIDKAVDAGAHLVILVEENRFKDRGEWKQVRNIADLLLWSSPYTQIRGEKVYRILRYWIEHEKLPISVAFCDKRQTGREILKIIYRGDFEPQEREENGEG